jgi:hypothetical protein
MDLIHGHNLGDIWFDLGEKARIAVVTKLVELESRLFALQFPTSGSLYYPEDLWADTESVVVPAGPASEGERRFCIGPETTLKLWYGRRQYLQVDRGPCNYGHRVLAHPSHPLQEVWVNVKKTRIR